MTARRPLRVMMTADAVGGVWIFATTLARALAERKCEINLVTLGPAPGERQLRVIAGAPGITLTVTDLALEWIDGQGGDFIRARRVLEGLENLFCPDVVHINGYREALAHWSAPVIVTAHSCVRGWWLACHDSEPPHREWSRYIRHVEKALNAADAWVAPTNAQRRLIESLYRPRRRGLAIWNGTGLTAVPDRKQPFVLAAGRLWDEAKGIAVLAEAAAAIEWPVKVAGSTLQPGGGRVTALSDVELLGDLDRDELHATMAAAEIFVSPARYEPFGLSVLEAAASGCALVLADIPTFRELWEGAALFFDPKDTAELQGAVNSVCKDGELRRRLQLAARTRSRSYPLGATADGYLAAYRRIGGDRRSSAADLEMTEALP